MQCSSEVDGFVIVDKCPRLTSREISAFIAKWAGTKAGHVGTLDPLVSGVLPVAVGRSRKLIRYVVGSEKEYVGVVRFARELPKERVESVFARFVGEITQIPPKQSAVAKRPRKRRVFSLTLLELEGKKALFRAVVEAGTYIRVLCQDIGKALGVKAVMDELRRVRVGGITEESAHRMEEIFAAFYLWREGNDRLLRRVLLPPDALLSRYPKVEISKRAAENLLRGAPLYRPGLLSAESFNQDEVVRVYCEGKFVGMGRAVVSSSEANQMRKGVVLRMERVHMRAF